MPSDKEEIFYANDLYCDDKMNYLCDVNPPCPPNEQYHCPYKGKLLITYYCDIVNQEIIELGFNC